MKKIPSLFKRDYDHGDRLVFDEVVEGSEWVLAGEGVATEKFDGTCCRVAGGKLWKRHDCKKNRKTGEFKTPPKGWVACEEKPNEHTGHWPGWVPVGAGPEDKWHREAWDNFMKFEGKTYELVGPKVQSNPYNLDRHELWRHGGDPILRESFQRSFDGIKDRLERNRIEGIVWHHQDGRMVKIKARDFGLAWSAK